MKLPISRTTATWVVLGLLALIFVWGGFTGRLGAVMGAIVAPAEMVVSPNAGS
jgi:hypothetical protein